MADCTLKCTIARSGGQVLLILALLCATPELHASCPAPSSNMQEPERIKTCLEGYRQRPGAGPTTLYHWGNPASISRMMTQSREAFCGFNQTRQKTRQTLSVLIQSLQSEGLSSGSILPVSMIEENLELVAGAFPLTVVSDEQRTDIASLSEPTTRVEEYLTLLSEVVLEYKEALNESNCQWEANPAIDCTDVDQTDQGKQDTTQALNTLQNGFKTMQLKAFPSYYSEPLPGATPVDPDDATVAVSMLEGYLTEINLFVSTASVSTDNNTQPGYEKAVEYRSSTTWGPGVYFGTSPFQASAHFAGGGIACDVSATRSLDLYGRALARKIEENEDGMAQPRTRLRNDQLIAAQILVPPSLAASVRYEHFTNASAFDQATRNELIRFGENLYLSKCAIEYSHCGAITVFDYDTCPEIANLLGSISGKMRESNESPTLFNYLRSGPSDGTQRDSSIGPVVFDSRLINEWRSCVLAQHDGSEAQALTEIQKSHLCPESILGRRNLVGIRTGVEAGIYTDINHPAGERYLPVIKEIGKLCRDLVTSARAKSSTR